MGVVRGGALRYGFGTSLHAQERRTRSLLFLWPFLWRGGGWADVCPACTDTPHQYGCPTPPSLPPQSTPAERLGVSPDAFPASDCVLPKEGLFDGPVMSVTPVAQLMMPDARTTRAIMMDTHTTLLTIPRAWGCSTLVTVANMVERSWTLLRRENVSVGNHLCGLERRGAEVCALYI